MQSIPERIFRLPTDDSQKAHKKRKLVLGPQHLTFSGHKVKTSSDDIHAYFSRYGKVVDVLCHENPSTRQPSGTGIVIFEQANSVEVALKEQVHYVGASRLKISGYPAEG